MLKKLLFVTAISSYSLMSPIAMAETSDSGFYLTAGVGTALESEADGSIDGTDVSVTGRTTFAGGIGIGYELDSNFRVEAAFFRSSADIDSVTIDGTKYDLDDKANGTGFEVAVAYDFENNSKITPYVGGSIGRGWGEESDASTFYGIDFGLSTPVSDEIELWGQVGLGISTDSEDDIDGYSVKEDGTTEWGFPTGLRIRL